MTHETVKAMIVTVSACISLNLKCSLTKQDDEYLSNFSTFYIKNKYNVIKEVAIVLFRVFKKTLAVCLIGLGLGILRVLLLPIAGWLFIIGVVIVCVGILWLSC